MKRTSTLRRMLGTGLGCVVLGATVVAMAAPAGAADAPNASGARRHRVHLTAEQKQCLSQQGITRPIRPLTPEKVAQLKDAAKACDIKLPLRRHVLTAEQKQCMQQQGITRPIRPLTAEKVQKIKDAATACGVQLPAKFGAKASA
jgi:mRNA-degrading endonuclease toxin of MazEF toxin-antitoxin module